MDIPQAYNRFLEFSEAQMARQADILPPQEQQEQHATYNQDDAELKSLWEESGIEIQSLVQMAASGMGGMGGGIFRGGNGWWDGVIGSMGLYRMERGRGSMERGRG